VTDQTEIVEVEETGRELAIAPQSGNVLAMVLDAARDPEVDATKMVALADLAIKLQDRERDAQFNRDLNAAKRDMPSIGRSGEVLNKAGKVQSRFSQWEKLNPIVTDILSNHNLTIGHEIGSTANGMISVVPILTHDNGMERRGAAMVFPADQTGNKSPAQAVVSSSSYGQRVTTIKLLNIRTHDEPDADGNRIVETADLPPEQQALVDAGRSSAMEGSVAYGNWFASCSPAEKGWLVFGKFHDQNKEAAALADQHQ
jgi:hypothetical protein